MLYIQDQCKTDARNYYSVGLEVVLLDDLVDKCTPGDNVDVRFINYVFLYFINIYL